MTDSLPILSPLAIRVLGTLVEKQRTVPDTYPLSLNALAAGCNQKTSRNPVMEASEAEILQALEELKEAALVIEVSGSRVLRFEHRMEKFLSIPSQASALLTVLMLRGPQTAGELRLNSERLHAFADISSVEAFLAELAERNSGPLVVELPRQAGSRENRWAHLLGGMPSIDHLATSKPAGTHNQEMAEMRERLASLEAQVSDLRSALAALQARS